MPKNKMTIESLAELVAKGFEETATKKELSVLKQDVDGLKQDVNGLKQDVDGLKQDVNGLKQDVDGLKQDVATIKSEMVTKPYLDDKMADLEGIVVVRQRKEDQKVNLLIELLRKKKVLGKTEIKMLQEIQVFPSFSKSSK